MPLAVILAGLALWLLRTGKLWQRVTVYEYQRGMLYHKGLLKKVLEQGQYWVYRPHAMVQTVDMRRTMMQVVGQEVLTQDHSGVKASLVAEYEVTDPRVAIHQAENYTMALHTRLQLALRQVTESMTLDQVLSDRTAIGEQVAAICQPAATELGVRLHSVAVRDLMLAADLKKAYADVVKAQKEGLAALERARGETAALRSLANAARMMEDQPMLLQLRWMQALGQGSGHSVILGSPGPVVPVPRGKTKGQDKDLAQPE